MLPCPRHLPHPSPNANADANPSLNVKLNPSLTLNHLVAGAGRCCGPLLVCCRCSSEGGLGSGFALVWQNLQDSTHETVLVTRALHTIDL